MLHRKDKGMFLNQLSNEEKNAFISLSVKIAESNGSFDESEKEMIQEYCKEMGIPFFDAEKALNMEKITEVFKESTDHIKGIVILESLGMAYSDGRLDPEEEELMNSFASKIGIGESRYEEIVELLNKYLVVLAELTEKI